MSKFSLLQREQSAGCPKGDQTKDGHGGPHPAPTQMRPGLADEGWGSLVTGKETLLFLFYAVLSFVLFCFVHCHFKSGMKQSSPQASIFPWSALPWLFISFSIWWRQPFRRWHQRCCYRCRLTLVSFALERILVGSNAPVETQPELSSFSIILFQHRSGPRQSGSPPAIQPFINLKHGHKVLESIQLHKEITSFLFIFLPKQERACSSGNKG